MVQIHDYCNILNHLFTITDFDLAVHVLEKARRKHFSFKHVIMGLAIFILVVLNILAAFNRPNLLATLDTKHKDEYIELVTANEGPSQFPGKSKIYRLFGAALIAYRY